MTTNKTSTHNISCQHENVDWGNNRRIDDDGLSVTIRGMCLDCNVLVEATYDNPKFTIVNPQTQEPMNYEKELTV